MNNEDMANKLFSDGDYKACIEMLKITPNNPAVCFYAGLSHVNTGNEDEAIKLFRDVLGIDPNHEQALRQLAWMLPNDVEKLSLLEKLARLNVAESDDLAMMADMYSEHNRLHDAHHWFHRALEKDAKNSLALLGLSEVHVKLAVRYLRETEDTQDIDLGEQMSNDRDIEDVLRFIYDEIINRAAVVDEETTLADIDDEDWSPWSRE